MKALSRIAYIVLGVTFAWAGVVKLSDPEAFLSSILTYQIFGSSVAVVAALVVPYLELCVGFSLATGALRGGGRWLAGGLTLVFLLLLFQGAIRGLNVDCGCFGSNAKSETTGYAWPIARDLLMLAGLAIGIVGERVANKREEQ